MESTFEMDYGIHLKTQSKAMLTQSGPCNLNIKNDPVCAIWPSISINSLIVILRGD